MQGFGFAAWYKRRDVLFSAPSSQHTYVIGRSGTGKTTYLEASVVSRDLGAGIGIVDPHGDFAARMHAASGHSKVTYLDAGDADAGLGYNPLRPVEPRWRPLVASGVLEVFKKAWPDAWGARMEHLLRNALLALLEQPEATLEDILRLMRDKDFRERVADNVAHEPVRRFWTEEYRERHEAIAPIQNKVGAFLADPTVYRIVCRPERQISFRRIMDEGQMLLVNLAKGRIGEDSSSLLGGLIVTSIGLAAFSRADMPEEKRRPFTLMIDEFQNYTTLAVANMIAELRKYGVNVVLAHQYLDQLDPQIRAAVLGNVGTLIAFRLGAKDAATMAPWFAPHIEPIDLMNLPNYEAYVKMTVGGRVLKPFSARTVLPEESRRMKRERAAEALRARRRAPGPENRNLREPFPRSLWWLLC